ncbi:MAG: response regulator [Ferruginibacter sp.]
MSKILVVDDSSDLLELFAFIFQTKGFEVKTAASRAKLEQELFSFNPDLILLDVKLQFDMGNKICREIKDDPASAHIPVILISANRELLQDYKDYKADDFIEKPFEMDQLIATITKYLPATAR